MLNHWLQLVVITPVMLYTGWPIHRINHSQPLYRRDGGQRLARAGTQPVTRSRLAGHAVPAGESMVHPWVVRAVETHRLSTLGDMVTELARTRRGLAAGG